jgi:hypothetical protein
VGPGRFGGVARLPCSLTAERITVPSTLSSLVALDVLAEGIRRHADIDYVPLHNDTAVLEIRHGDRPLLLLDTDSADADIYWAMSDAHRLLAFGPRWAESAVPDRRLRSVG